jgi:glutathione peroxidase
MASAYDFTFETLAGKPYPLRELAGRPLVVVNTASKCGFTPQYKGLEALWKQYQAAGLVVIGVPSNDFGNQEPGTSAEISSFCEINYGVDFPMMGKVKVTGESAHPFFKFVASEGGMLCKPRWNFFKYLINRQGGLADWFTSVAKPDSAKFRTAVEQLLT